MKSFSIITVVYNDVAHIAQTMQSVIHQTYKNIQYILIDGNSTDGTKEKILEILEMHATITHHSTTPPQVYREIHSEIRNYLKQPCDYYEAMHRECPSFSFVFLSQRDGGIFDAMNKGVLLSQKDYINFVNCGDRLHQRNTLETIAKLPTNAPIIYGDLEISHDNHHFLKKTSHNLEDLYTLFYDFGHSNCFIATTLHKNILYDTRYHLAGDYDLIYRIYKQGYEFYFSDCVISTFSSGGASDVHGYKSLKEALHIALFYNQNSPSMRAKIYLYYLFALLKKTIKLYFPKPLTNFLLKSLR